MILLTNTIISASTLILKFMPEITATLITNPDVFYRWKLIDKLARIIMFILGVPIPI